VKVATFISASSGGGTTVKVGELSGRRIVTGGEPEVRATSRVLGNRGGLRAAERRLAGTISNLLPVDGAALPSGDITFSADCVSTSDNPITGATITVLEGGEPFHKHIALVMGSEVTLHSAETVVSVLPTTNLLTWIYMCTTADETTRAESAAFTIV
jgi:hypothetical protein